MDTVVYVGGYGPGISIFSRDGSRLTPIGTTPTPDPSFLIADPRRGWLFSTNELIDHTVSAFGIEPDGTLTHRDTRATGGTLPCHLLLHPAGYLLTANYGTGSVAVHPVTEDGGLGERVYLAEHSGSGPDPDRQAGPHAHQIKLLSGAVMVVDLGSDRLIGYRLDPGDGALRPLAGVFGRAPSGAGPRHAVVHPTGRWYVTNELDSTVSIFEPDFDIGGVRLLDSVPATGSDTSANPDGRNYPAGIELSADGTRIYVSNRGADSLVTFAVEENGTLRQLAEISSDGRWPRHFAIVDDLMLVANQRSDSITGFRLRDGLPEPLGVLAEVASPTCVLPLRLTGQ